MGFFSKVKVTSDDIFYQAYSHLRDIYGQVAETFTPSSPYGQILYVLSNLTSLILSHVEHAASEMNIMTAQTAESIYGLSRLTGHDPCLGYSSRGVISLRCNTSAASLVEGTKIIIDRYTQLKISESGLTYFMNISTPTLEIPVNERDNWYDVEIIQGEFKTAEYTGTGERLQSYDLAISGMVDDDLITVRVNDTDCTIVESLYDMNPNEYACMVKTSVTGGLSFFFGNGEFGRIPKQGEKIQITYITHNGLQGNVNTSSFSIKFLDSAQDDKDNSIDLNQVLSVAIIQPPIMGCNPEDIEFTRLIAPKNSRNFVLATPQNYVSFLSRYNAFSFIDAFNTKGNDNDYLEDDNVIYLSLLPDIKKKLGTGNDYFTIPQKEFKLTEYEREYVKKLIAKSGRQLLTSVVEIPEAKIYRYGIVVLINYFENANKKQIRMNVRTSLNEYFLNINRKDRIPKSDIIALLEKIDGIDSVNIFFISEENEKKYRKKLHDILQYDPDFLNRDLTKIPSQEMAQKIHDIFLNPYDYIKYHVPNLLQLEVPIAEQQSIVGRDDVVYGNREIVEPGSTLYEKAMRARCKKLIEEKLNDEHIGFDEGGNIYLKEFDTEDGNTNLPYPTLAIIRGGWYDRFNNYIDEKIEDTNLSGLTILFRDEIDSDVYNELQELNFEHLLENKSN